MKKNIFIISSMDLWFGNEAGVKRMRNYAKSLLLKDVKIYNCTILRNKKFGIENIKELEKNCYVVGEYQNKTYKNPITYILNMFKFFRNIKVLLEKTEGEKLIILYPFSQILPNFFALFYLGCIEKYRIYCEVNELKRTNYDAQKYFGLKYIFYFLEEIFSRYYTGLICITKHIENYYTKYNRNSIVVPILSNTDLIHTSPFLASFTSKSKFIVVFTGSIILEKENLKEFLLGLSLINNNINWEFHLYGSLNSKNSRLLKKYVLKYKIEDKVKYMGIVQHDKINQILKNANLLVLPRKNTRQNYYGFSTKLSEYITSGIPVLLTDTGVVSDYFKDNINCYMVNGYKANDYKMRIEDLYINYNTTARFIASNALELSNEVFSYENYSELLYSFLFSQQSNNIKQ